jgi:hypothetical protein
MRALSFAYRTVAVGTLGAEQRSVVVTRAFGPTTIAPQRSVR